MRNLNKRKIIIITIFFLIGLLVCFVVNRYLQKRKHPELPKQEYIEYQNLKLGISTKEDVIYKLGKPVSTQTQNSSEILEYKSKNPNFNNELLIKDDKLNFVKEILTLEDNIKVSDIQKGYGLSEKILYGRGASIGFYLYAYPSKGFAYIGHEKSGTVKERWYFTPTDIKTFQEKLASDYSETIQPIQ